MKYKIGVTKYIDKALKYYIYINNTCIIIGHKAFPHTTSHFEDPPSQSGRQRYFSDYYFSNFN